MTPTPVFLLSLPRAGSTLVQRVLAASGDVATAPEPWILLPQLYALREKGIAAEYGQIPASRAIRDFASRLDGGEAAYEDELRAFAERLYGRAGPEGARYFLDKTPRYHLIAEDLFRVFADARFVFLWRNPLAVAASIVETWGRGRWIVDRYRVDLLDGVENLVRAYERNRARATAVRYEDLVAEPGTAWPRLFGGLDLRFDPAVLDGFSEVRLDARMGDPTGTKRYNELSTEPLEKWRSTLRGSVRIRWAKGYLESLGRDKLAVMGYDVEELRGQLDGLGGAPARTGSDLVRAGYARATIARRRRALETLQHRRGRGPDGPDHRP
ncbi:MAG: sulfotransferase family protein [Actinomycetota bacterium]